MDRALKALVILLVALVLAVVICVGAAYVLSGGQIIDWAQTTVIRLSLSSREDDLNHPVSTDSTPVRFTVTLGDTSRVIAANLSNARLISDANLFIDYVRANELDQQLEAGVYFLNQALTIPQIAVALTDSGSSQILFRILEGWRIEEVAAAITNNPYFGFTGQDFLTVVRRGSDADPDFAAQVGLPAGASLEGFLFPDTYQLPAEVTPIMLRDILTDAFIAKVGGSLTQDASAQGLSLYQVVTLASIVQRESVRSDENPMIASVYRNRLSIGQKLDADPTVQYAIGFQNDTWWPQITQADYTNIISSYNTYLNTGLPPGPIANPGMSAIEAAVYPQQTPYYYFRARCDGSGYHAFAVTFDEHVNNAC